MHNEVLVDERSRVFDEVSVRIAALNRLRDALRDTKTKDEYQRVARAIAEGEASLKPIAQRLKQINAALSAATSGKCGS
jgi:hypothetical protein